MDIGKIFEDEKKAGLLRKAVIGVMGALVVADVFIHALHPHFPWDKVPGFNALLGVAAAAAIIFLATGLGSVLRRQDDHYDSKEEG